MSFNDVLLVITWCSPYESLTRTRLQAKPGFVGKHLTPTVVVSAMHALYSRLIVGDSELYSQSEVPRDLHKVYEHVDQSALSSYTRSVLKLSFQWLKRACETGLMLCSVYFYFGSNYRIPVFIRRCNSGVTFAVTSTHITIILELLPKPGDDTLGDSKFFGCFQLGKPHSRGQ
ncbi:uncharacterized protein TNCV_5128461 [Trichonephila clavipes]|nr:uncharacterized protein TNCV_5128461 [Trichonephila clavipes]